MRIERDIEFFNIISLLSLLCYFYILFDDKIPLCWYIHKLYEKIKNKKSYTHLWIGLPYAGLNKKLVNLMQIRKLKQAY